MIDQLKKEIMSNANPLKAKDLAKFFKTGPGDYGEGDVFLGLIVPVQRKIAKKYTMLSLDDLDGMISSKYHEFRLISLFILRNKYEKADDIGKRNIVGFYLKNAKYVNNWDLVDSSASYLLGNYLLDKDRSVLYKLVKSSNLWEKRISIISTGAFIRENQFDDTFKIAEVLLGDEHDLIHKAVGWMLREVGKRDIGVEEAFLISHYKQMPRTMLRYAIEKFTDSKREFYLKR